MLLDSLVHSQAEEGPRCLPKSSRGSEYLQMVPREPGRAACLIPQAGLSLCPVEGQGSSIRGASDLWVKQQ